MRIISGELKGRRLQAPPKGDQTIRPTSDKVRESIFNLLTHRGLDFSGASGLDLFAGTGALGIEAISRGAEKVLWVEQNPLALRLIHQNLKNLGLNEMEGQGVLPISVEAFFKNKKNWQKYAEHFPLRFIFLDPPYAFAGSESVLQSMASLDQEMAFFESQAWIIFEASSKDVRSYANINLRGFEYFGERTYGGTKIHFWRKGT